MVGGGNLAQIISWKGHVHTMSRKEMPERAPATTQGFFAPLHMSASDLESGTNIVWGYK